MKKSVIICTLILLLFSAHIVSGQVASQRVVFVTANPPTICSPGKLFSNSVAQKVWQGTSTSTCVLVGSGAGTGANTFTGAQNISAAGASSTSPLLLSGTIFTGGGTTATKPQLLIEPAGATSNNWNNNGTALGVNTAAGFGGDLINLQINAVQFYRQSSSGDVTQLGALTLGNNGANKLIVFSASSSIGGGVDGNILLRNNAANNFNQLQLGGTTSSFPSVKRSTAGLAVRLADDSADSTMSASAFVAGGATPAVSSGTIGTGSKNTAGFITSATTGAYTGILTFSGVTATTGWSCVANNMTTANLLRMTANNTTTATISGTTVSGDVLNYICHPY